MLLIIGFASVAPAQARCLLKLMKAFQGSTSEPSDSHIVKQARSSDLVAIPKNSENWAPLLSKVKGDAVAKQKFLKSLEAYDGVNSTEFQQLKNFLNTDAAKEWSIVLLNREGPSVADVTSKTIKIYLDDKTEGAVAFTDSKNKVHHESAAHTFFHELWHAKDYTEQHPASVQQNTDIFENPINQLSREYRANLAAYGSAEAAWKLTDARYSSRVRNVEALLPIFKTLDLEAKVKLLDRLAELPNTQPQAARNLHAYWWTQKHANSWNEEQRTLYLPDAGFNPQNLVRSLLADLAVDGG